MNRTTSSYYFHSIRGIIFYDLEQEADAVFKGEMKVGGSYYGGKQKGKREHGAAGKTFVYGSLKRGGKVHKKVSLDDSLA